jgi:hypothetical protein
MLNAETARIRDRRECAPQWHDKIRHSLVLFARCTTPIGEQDDGDGGTITLAVCDRCGSTLALVDDLGTEP